MKVWISITAEFNSIPGVTQRSVTQLKKLFQNMKDVQKEKFRIQRHNSCGTGGGKETPYDKTPDPLDNTNFIVIPIEGTIDSDGNRHTDKLEDTKNPDSPIELREIEEEIVMDLVEDCQTLAGFTETPNATLEPIRFKTTPLKRGSIGKKRKQELIVDEFDARCNKVMQQTLQDTEAHKYLIKKLNQEAELAKVLAKNAEKSFSVEEERKLDSFLKNEEFIEEKRKIELKMVQDRAEFERKKQELELKFLEAKYEIDLENLKK